MSVSPAVVRDLSANPSAPSTCAADTAERCAISPRAIDQSSSEPLYTRKVCSAPSSSARSMPRCTCASASPTATARSSALASAHSATYGRAADD
eukprot:scaffold40390_cov26-Tisochrysis_lutea.AAC.2